MLVFFFCSYHLGCHLECSVSLIMCADVARRAMFATEDRKRYSLCPHSYCSWHLYNLYIIKWFIFNVYACPELFRLRGNLVSFSSQIIDPAKQSDPSDYKYEMLRIHLAELQSKVSVGTEEPVSVILATGSGIVTKKKTKKNTQEMKKKYRKQLRASCC